MPRAKKTSQSVEFLARRAFKAADKMDINMDDVLSKAERLQYLNNTQKKSRQKSSNDMDEISQGIGNSIFFMGLRILEVAHESVTSDKVITKEQGLELAGIGKEFVSIGANLVFGKKNLKESLEDFAKSLKKLGKFFKDNPEIAVKIGVKILESLYPITRSIKKGLAIALESPMGKLAKQGLIEGLRKVCLKINDVENAIKAPVERKLATNKRLR